MISIQMNGTEASITYPTLFRPSEIASRRSPNDVIFVTGRGATELIRLDVKQEIERTAIYYHEGGAVYLEDRLEELGVPDALARRTRSMLRRSSTVQDFRITGAEDYEPEGRIRRIQAYADLLEDRPLRSAIISGILQPARRSQPPQVDPFLLREIFEGIKAPGWKAFEMPVFPHLEEFLLLDAWDTGGRNGPLIAYTLTYDDLDVSTRAGSRIVSRDYINFSDLRLAVSAALSTDIAELNRIYKIWETVSVTLLGDDPHPDTLTISDAENYVSTVAAYKAGQTPTEQIVEALPRQVAAPVLFADDNGKIDIADAEEEALPLPKSSGGARALQNILADFRDSSPLDNVLPAFRRKADRISNILDLFKAGQADEGYVVELGLEINSLATLVEYKEEYISQLEDLAAFVEPANAYLDQFSVWKSYDESLSSSQASAVGSGADIGKELLQSVLASQDVLTGRAKIRIDAYVADIDPKQASVGEREGIARTSENLTSALTRKALEIAEKEMGSAAEDAAHSGRVIAQNALGKVLKENASEFLKFANARKLYWLGKLMALLLGGSDQ